jgi:VCBS repeat protein/FG-GAP repeat protein
MRAFVGKGMISVLVLTSGCGSGTATIVAIASGNSSSGDRNAPPIAVVGDAAFVVNPDGRRGIPIPFDVRDREGETVDLVFQWRRPDQSFTSPELRLPATATREEIAALVADPAFRRLHQIATEMPATFGGTIALVAGDAAGARVRLPELAGPAAGLLARGVAGRTLEILAADGSVEQRRSILAYGPHGFVATVDAPFDPPLAAGRHWRITKVVNPIVGTAGGLSDTFLWDSSDASIPRDVFLRAIPVDSVIGIPGETSIAKRLSPRFDLANVAFPDPNTAQQPVFAAAADLDGDGLVDLVSTNTTGSEDTPSTTIFFQRRLGEFVLDPNGAVDRSYVLADPFCGAIGDVNGDGRPDLVIGNARFHVVTIYYQTDPPGTFETTPVELHLADASNPAGRPFSVALADFDGDGRIDVVSANEIGHDLTVFLQTSPGTFVAQSLRVRTIDQPKSVVVGDVDGDGLLDVVSANDAGDCLSIFFHQPDHTFSATPTNVSLSAGSHPLGVAAGDLNADGRLDLVAADSRTDDVAILFQDPAVAGTFLPPTFIGGVDVTRGTQSVAIGDLDHDGNVDVVAAATTGNDLAVFFQIRPGEWIVDPRGTLGDAAHTARPVSVALADVDGDGSLDILSANQFGHDLALFSNPPRGAFALDALGPLGGSGQLDMPVALGIGDLDGDGDLDLVAANLNGNRLTIFKQTTPSRFNVPPGGVLSDASTIQPQSVAVADLDGDGLLDVVSDNLHTSTLSIFRQESPGEFSFQTALPLSADPNATITSSVVAADLNADGWMDLVATNSEENEIEAFLQAPGGGFGAGSSVVHVSATAPVGLVAADVDGDGLLDLVTTNTSFRSGNVAIFYATSPGVFETTAHVVGSRGVTDGPIVVGDVDRDGRVDVLCAHSNSNEVSIFFQDETPRTFERDPLVLELSDDPKAFPSPASIAVGDFDGDGDLDLAIADEGTDTVVVFVQASPRQFPSQLRQTLGGSDVSRGAHFMATADLDGDGELDLITANELNNTLTIFYAGH